MTAAPCRVKTAFMTSTQVAKDAVQPSMLQTIVESQFHTDIAKWIDEGGCWWRTFPARVEKTQKGIGATFYRFVTAYIAAVLSGCDEPGEYGKSCKAIRSKLEGHPEGEVPMSAVIKTFQDCPALLFSNTLALLKWSGHVKKLATLHQYKFALMLAVKCFTVDQCRNVANPSDRVCSLPFVCSSLRLMARKYTCRIRAHSYLFVCHLGIISTCNIPPSALTFSRHSGAGSARRCFDFRQVPNVVPTSCDVHESTGGQHRGQTHPDAAG